MFAVKLIIEDDRGNLISMYAHPGPCFTGKDVRPLNQLLDSVLERVPPDD
jgi:hypothetical protein